MRAFMRPRKVLQSPPTRAQAGAERPLTSVSTGQPGAVNHPRRGVQPLESDDEDDLWTLVSKAKPTGKKAAIYVGNLDDTAGEEKLREYINRRSRKAGISIGYRPRWRSDIWRTDRGVAEVRSPDIRPATEDDIRHDAPGLVETVHRLYALKYAENY